MKSSVLYILSFLLLQQVSATFGPPPLQAVFTKILHLLESDRCFTENSKDLIKLCTVGTEYAFTEKALRLATCNPQLFAGEENPCCRNSLQECLQSLSGRQWKVYNGYLQDLKNICFFYKSSEPPQNVTLLKIQDLLKTLDTATYIFYLLLVLLALIEGAPRDYYYLIVLFILAEFGAIWTEFEIGKKPWELKGAVIFTILLISRLKKALTKHRGSLRECHSSSCKTAPSAVLTSEKPRIVEPDAHSLYESGKKSFKKILTKYNKEEEKECSLEKE